MGLSNVPIRTKIGIYLEKYADFIQYILPPFSNANIRRLRTEYI